MEKDTILEEHKEHVRRNRMASSGLWKWSTAVLLILLIVSVFANGLPNFGGKLSQDYVSGKAIAFINQNLLTGFATANLESASELGDLYKLDILLVSNFTGEEQNATLYVTKDGNLLFPSAIDLSDFVYEMEIKEEVKEELSESELTLVVEESDDPIVGNPNASLSIIEYSDFECPFCGEAYWTVKLLLEQYPEQVNLEYKNFILPSKHPNAQKAAEASECAHAQGAFEAYYNKLFENQAALTVDDLKQYALDLELDTEAFNTCLDSGEMAEKVAADQSEGTSAGVEGTPTFFIGEQKVEGNKKFSDFQVIIEEELAKLALVEEEAVGEEVSNQTEESSESSNVSEEAENGTEQATTMEQVIEITSAGFSPSTVTVSKGTRVIFVNTDATEHWPASNAHPTHEEYPGSSIEKCGTEELIFDACKGLAEDESWSFTFTEVGEWRYHDHLKAGRTGSITVQ